MSRFCRRFKNTHFKSDKPGKRLCWSWFTSI